MGWEGEEVKPSTGGTGEREKKKKRMGRREGQGEDWAKVKEPRLGAQNRSSNFYEREVCSVGSGGIDAPDNCHRLAKGINRPLK